MAKLLTAGELAPATPPWRAAWLPWLGLLALTLALYAAAGAVPWAFEYPRAWVVPLKDWINGLMHWLREDASFGLFTFQELTRAIAWLLEQPFILAKSLLSTGFARGVGQDASLIWPRLPWVALIGILALMAHHAKDWGLALLVALCFFYLALFGQWESAMVTLASIAIAVPLGVLAGLALGIARLPAAGVRARDHAGARSDADRAGVRLSRADPLVLRLQPGRGDDRDRDLRDPADGPQRGARAAAGAERGPGLRPDGGLLAPPDDVARADPVGAAMADGRRQPGDHAVAQHGDHRVDDRRGRARPRRADRAAPPRLRRRARGGDRDHAARDRSRSPEPGLRRPPATAPRRGRAIRAQAPPPSVRGAGAIGAELAARRLRAGGPDLAAGLGDHHRRCRRSGGRLDQRPLLRRDRGGQGLAADQPDGAGQALPARAAVDRGGRGGSARRLAAGRRRASRS